MNIELLQRWLALDARKRGLDSELSDVTTQMDTIHDVVVDGLLEDGITSLKISDRTVYIQKQIWARALPEHRVKLAHVLEALDMAHMIGINAQSLSALFRPDKDSDEPANVPQEVADLAEVYEKVSLRSRKAP